MLGFLKNVFGGGAGPADLEAGIAAYQRGDLAAAERLLERVVGSDPANSTARAYAGLIGIERDRYQDALRHFEALIALDPSRPEFRHHAANAALLADDRATARIHCEEALRLSPDHFPSQNLLSLIELPGPVYFDVLSLIHETLRPRTYFEVGVFKGQSLARVSPDTRAIGVDPQPQVVEPLPAHFVIHAVTSDDYFERHDVKAEFGGLPIDLAFIDGLHHFEQALRDFINVEKHCAAGSTILIHDCYPLSRRTADRTNWSGFHSGDIWRLILALKKYRPDLRLHTIGTAPTGLGVVRNLDPASPVLERSFESIVAEFMAFDYDGIAARKAEMLNLVPNEAEGIRALLRRSAG